MKIKEHLNLFTSLVIITIILMGMMPVVWADVYINVLAVNGTERAKDSFVKYNLPGDLTSQDIIDTNGLDLDYNVNDSNYYVHGTVALQPKESKTFRIRVRDVWKLSPAQLDQIKNKIEEGYEQIGKLKDPQQGELLKEKLIQRLDFLQEKSSKAETVEKRIDAFRIYSKELQRIENSALAVDYWRSDPSEVKQDKIIHFSIAVENPFDKPRPYKNKQYLPSEIKPEDLVEFEGFEVRFDQEKKQTFLFKEEELQPKEKKKYTIGIRDIWFIAQKDIEYLRQRANYVNDFLKDSRYASTCKFLFDQVNELLKNIEDSQAQKRSNILEHISIFRDNQNIYERAKTDVETLEKLLSAYRENLQKSKVENVLQKVRSLKSFADISKAIFNKAPTESVTWKFIFWVLLFVGFLTSVNFIVWIFRSKAKNVSAKTESPSDVGDKNSSEKKTS